MHASAMLMILDRQSLSLKMSFQWHHVILSGPGAELLEHLWIADLNSYLENGIQTWLGLWSISLRMLVSTWWWRAMLNILWRASHRLLGVRQGWLLYSIASVAGGFLLLTQFINSQGPWLLFAISWILLLKNNHLASLIVDLNVFQFSRLFEIL